jgi:ankyrin repeat protein
MGDGMKLLVVCLALSCCSLYGETALEKAVQSGNVDEVKTLIKTKVDLNARNRQGYTALMIAASKGNLAIVKLLVEAGADITGGSVGKSPFNLSEPFDDTRNYLKEQLILLDEQRQREREGFARAKAPSISNERNARARAARRGR